MDSLEPVLAKHPFLEGLSEDQLALLVGCASQVRFSPGEFLFHMGEDADEFYLLRHGKVALELFTSERGAITVMTVADGEAAGWSWIVPPYKWELDGRAVAPTLALRFDAACLRGKCESDHEFGYQMYKRFAPVIAKRLQATRLQVLDVHRAYA
jgi:CRP/FNR family cyclic AMP-dependent transcriptional regulator